MLSGGVGCSGQQQNENKTKQKNRQILGPCLRTKKAVEHEGDSDTNCNWELGTVPKCSKRGIEQLEIRGRIKTIWQNTSKNPEELRNFAVTQTPVNDHLLMLLWKTPHPEACWIIASGIAVMNRILRKFSHSAVEPFFCLHIVVWYQVFLSNTNNLLTILWFQVFLSNTNNLHTILWFQVFLSNTNNLHTILWFYVLLP